MNWQVFGTIGYLSVALGIGALAIWLIHWFKQHRFLPYIGLVMAIAAMFCARHNSSTYVNRVQADPSIMLAKMAEAQRKKEQAMINARTEEVDNIQFAEDARGENLDKAGMDEVDLKYMKAIMGEDEPAWKKEKRKRGDATQEDNSLESKMGATVKSKGADVAALEEDKSLEPILLNEASVVLSQQLDLWNLNFSKCLMLIAVLILIIDYIRRANIYSEALWPIPLPSTWLDAFTPHPVVFHQPEVARRDIASQLSWFTRRGDQWVYFTERKGESADIKKSLEKLKNWPYRLDLIQVDDRTDNEFVMESTWYGRASFICDDTDRCSELLDYYLSQLKHRHITRARALQYVHLIWDCEEELSQEALDAFEQCAAVSGVSLYVTSQNNKGSSSRFAKEPASTPSEE